MPLRLWVVVEGCPLSVAAPPKRIPFQSSLARFGQDLKGGTKNQKFSQSKSNSTMKSTTMNDFMSSMQVNFILILPC